jgi:hypothetical protein
LERVYKPIDFISITKLAEEGYFSVLRDIFDKVRSDSAPERKRTKTRVVPDIPTFPNAPIVHVAAEISLDVCVLE